MPCKISKALLVTYSLPLLYIICITTGKDIIQLVVPGVNLSFLKRPYDSTFNSIVQDVCVVDQLQSFGPDFELLVCSGIKVLYQDNFHTSLDSTTDCQAETTTPSALLSLCVSSFTPFSPKHPKYDKQAASPASCGLQTIAAKCSGLDVLGVCAVLVVCSLFH